MNLSPGIDAMEYFSNDLRFHPVVNRELQPGFLLDLNRCDLIEPPIPMNGKHITCSLVVFEGDRSVGNGRSSSVSCDAC